MAVDVACGAGFSLCVTHSGRVLSWGMWAHGRLGSYSFRFLYFTAKVNHFVMMLITRWFGAGLGPIPVVQMTIPGRSSWMRRGSRATTGGSRKLARYQLRPAEVLGLGRQEMRAVSVSCGEAHALCVLAGGALLVWGQNHCGQLGCGVSAAGQLCDAFSPLLLPPFLGASATSHSRRLQAQLAARFRWGQPSVRFAEALREAMEEPNGRVSAASAVCGTYHSCVIDSLGHAWTWGARGG